MLERHGLRHTRQRQAVLTALLATAEHPTAEELFESVRQREPGISLATVYNTLDAFVRRGLARKLLPGSSAEAPGSPQARYDADTSDHAHLVTQDGRVRDVPEDLSRALREHLPQELIEAIERRMGVRVDDLRVEVRATTLPGGAC